MTQVWPSHWEADVVTADGGIVHVRPITPDDADRLVAFHGRQSPESIYFRYFSPRPTLSAAEVRNFTHVDHRDRAAFIALLGQDLIGVARYDALRDRDEAEVAFFIDDQHQGRGLATILLEYLVAAARQRGIRTFFAQVLPANRKMLGVFRQAGFEVTTRFADGVVEVRFDIHPTRTSLAAVEERQRRAEARSVGRLLAPRTIAVIGAGRRRGTIGHEVFRQLLAHEFAGAVYPVNREALHVASVRAWPSVLDVPDRVDLAVVAVPSEEVLDAVEECGRARVGALVVVSTGFADAGPVGVERAKALVSVARRHGMRLLGPASLGVVNTSESVRMHATFASLNVVPGRLALSLQSGSLGVGIVERATSLGLGLSAVVAVGDKADVSGNDLLAWWEDDERTDAVLLSLESFGNPRRFRRVARRVARHKPVVALVRDAPDVDELLLNHSGVIRAEGVDSMLEVAQVLAWQPIPTGRRLAIVADSGGAAGFTRAAATAAGLEPAVLSEPTMQALRELRTGRSEPGEPVDLGVDSGPREYEAALDAVLDDPGVDCVLVVHTGTLAPRPAQVAMAVARAASRAAGTTVVASFPGLGLPGSLVPEGEWAIPNIGFPDAAARALAKVADHGAWLGRPEGVDVEPDGVDLRTVRAVVEQALVAGAAALSMAATAELLRAAGLCAAQTGLVSSSEEAVTVADAIGYPVALKASQRRKGSRTEAAGVALDVQDGDDVRRTHERMAAALGPAMHEVVVQAMVPPGEAVAVRIAPAPVVGAAVDLGPGGAVALLVGPTARTVLPLTDVAAADLVERSGLAAPLGEQRTRALLDVVARVSHVAEEVPEIVRFELNPVIVGPDGAWCTDVAVDVAPVVATPPPWTRGL